jgi:hypothetical protein
MTTIQKELFRKAILRVLDANRTRFGLGTVHLAFRLADAGFLARDFGGEAQFHEAIEEAIEYLTQKGLIVEAKKEISPENRAWRITEAGIAFLDSGA